MRSSFSAVVRAYTDCDDFEERLTLEVMSAAGCPHVGGYREVTRVDLLQAKAHGVLDEFQAAVMTAEAARNDKALCRKECLHEMNKLKSELRGLINTLVELAAVGDQTKEKS